MARIDPEKERARLAEVYSQQTDEELQESARHLDDLTDVARESFRTELSRRGLTPDQSDECANENRAEPAFRNLITVRSFWNLVEAELAKGMLEAAGIECFLFDDNMVRMDWFQANAIGGVKLRVDPENVAEATRILDETDLSAEPGPEDR
jgi:hypothetical protein